MPRPSHFAAPRPRHIPFHWLVWTFSFWLGALLIPQPSAAQSMLSCGQVINESIGAPLEQDQFTFFGEQGDVVTFTLVQTGSLDPGFLVAAEVLYPPVSSFRSAFLAQVRNVTLPFTGTYTARVRDNGNTARGSYSLRFGWLLPSNKHCGDHTALACGQVVNGSIAMPLEQDLFTFVGDAGSTVTFTLVQTGTLDAGFLVGAEVLYPSVSSFRSAFFGPIRNVTLPFTGTYVVRLLDFQNTRRGTYSLRYGLLTPCPSAPVQPPGPPTNLTASVVGTTVTLNWLAPATGGAVTSYVVEAGRAPGDSSVTVSDTGTTSTTLSAVSVPFGTYFVRVKARNSDGTSAASNEVVILVGSGPGPCSAPPLAPTGLGATVTGQAVTVRWTAPPGPVTTYIIEAGSFSSAANIANFSTGNSNTLLMASATSGTYFVRVRAANVCGTSTPSIEVVVTVF